MADDELSRALRHARAALHLAYDGPAAIAIALAAFALILLLIEGLDRV